MLPKHIVLIKAYLHFDFLDAPLLHSSVRNYASKDDGYNITTLGI